MSAWKFAIACAVAASADSNDLWWFRNSALLLLNNTLAVATAAGARNGKIPKPFANDELFSLPASAIDTQFYINKATIVMWMTVLLVLSLSVSTFVEEMLLLLPASPLLSLRLLELASTLHQIEGHITLLPGRHHVERKLAVRFVQCDRLGHDPVGHDPVHRLITCRFSNTNIMKTIQTLQARYERPLRDHFLMKLRRHRLIYCSKKPMF